MALVYPRLLGGGTDNRFIVQRSGVPQWDDRVQLTNDAQFQRIANDGFLGLRGSTTGAYARLFGHSHGTYPGEAHHDAATFVFNDQAGSTKRLQLDGTVGLWALAKVRAGSFAGANQVQMYHNGTNGYIETLAGALYLVVAGLAGIQTAANFTTSGQVRATDVTIYDQQISLAVSNGVLSLRPNSAGGPSVLLYGSAHATKPNIAEYAATGGHAFSGAAIDSALGYKAGGSAGVTAGPFTSITSIQVKNGLVIGLSGS